MVPKEWLNIHLAVGTSEDGCLSLKIDGAEIRILENGQVEVHFGKASMENLLATKSALNEVFEEYIRMVTSGN